MKNQFVRSITLAVILAALPIVAFGRAAAPEAKAKPSPEVMRYLQEGSAAYLKHDFANAIGVDANGKVFVGTTTGVAVFGLLH